MTLNPYLRRVVGAAALLGPLTLPAHAQKDPGVRGVTAGMLQYNAMLTYLKTRQNPATRPSRTRH